MRDRRAGATVWFGGQSEILNMRVLGQDGMDSIPELANPFAVNDSYFENSAFAAKLEVIQDDGLYVFRTKGMQVQHSINRQFNRQFHIRESTSGISSNCPIMPRPAIGYQYSHKEVIDNIAFSDQERFSSESRSWLLGVDFFQHGDRERSEYLLDFPAFDFFAGD